MTTYLLGLGIALASIFASIAHLNEHVGSYVDFVGLMIVFGGTVSVSAMTIPWQLRAELRSCFGDLLHARQPLTKLVVVDAVNIARGGSTYTSRDLPGEIFRDGIELKQLGLDRDELEKVLSERIETYVARRYAISNAIRSISKFPPAFGLMGTVLGLVNLMRAIAAGAPSSEVGLKMSVALSATLYGILLANLFVSPMADFLNRFTTIRSAAALIAMRGVLLSTEGVTSVVAQERINSLVSPAERLGYTERVDNPAESPSEAA